MEHGMMTPEEEDSWQQEMNEERKAKTLEVLKRMTDNAEYAEDYADIDFLASELGLLDEWRAR